MNFLQEVCQTLLKLRGYNLCRFGGGLFIINQWSSIEDLVGWGN
jgi:hypothetical protein